MQRCVAAGKNGRGEKMFRNGIVETLTERATNCLNLISRLICWTLPPVMGFPETFEGAEVRSIYDFLQGDFFAKQKMEK